jgi:hypothetical protein
MTQAQFDSLVSERREQEAEETKREETWLKWAEEKRER